MLSFRRRNIRSHFKNPRELILRLLAVEYFSSIQYVELFWLHSRALFVSLFGVYANMMDISLWPDIVIGKFYQRFSIMISYRA